MLTQPRELFVNPNARSLYATQQLMDIMPGSLETARAVDASYITQPLDYIERLTGSVRTIDQPFGVDGTKVDFSIFYDDRSDKAKGIDLIIAPLNDCAPLADPNTYYEYVTNPKATEEDRELAQPNSFRRAIKTANVHEANIEQGSGRPTVVIYATDTEIFTQEQRDLIARGITTPYGEVAEMVLQQAQQEIHGAKSESQLEDVFVSASGVSHIGVGVAEHLKQTGKYTVASLLANNLIANVNNVLVAQPKAVARFLDKFKLLRQYSVRQYSGEPGEYDSAAYEIPETAASQEGDKLGSEKAMRKRQLEAMLDFTSLSAMMQSGYVNAAIGRLLSDGVMVTLSRPHNARITEATSDHLPETHPNLERIEIKSGVKGEKIGLITGEFDRLDYTLVVHGAQRAIKSHR